MSLFDMQGMTAEEGQVQKNDGRSTLSTLSSAVIAGRCQNSLLSVLAQCN